MRAFRASHIMHVFSAAAIGLLWRLSNAGDLHTVLGELLTPDESLVSATLMADGELMYPTP